MNYLRGRFFNEYSPSRPRVRFLLTAFPVVRARRRRRRGRRDGEGAAAQEEGERGGPAGRVGHHQGHAQAGGTAVVQVRFMLRVWTRYIQGGAATREQNFVDTKYEVPLTNWAAGQL